MWNWILDHLVLSICLLAIVVCLIAIVVILIVKKCKNKKTDSSIYDELIECFGGIDNIVSATARESRLSLVLKNYDLVNNELLNEKGVSSSIRMSNKITFVIGTQAKDIEAYINSLIQK